VALESLYEFCSQTNRKRRPRRESPDFKVVDKVMEWWLGDEWRNSNLEQQEKHLRSATQWANQRVKRSRHRLVDDAVLESRLDLLLRMASNGNRSGPAQQAIGTHPLDRENLHYPVTPLPHFQGSARDWAAQLGQLGLNGLHPAVLNQFAAAQAAAHRQQQHLQHLQQQQQQQQQRQQRGPPRFLVRPPQQQPPQNLHPGMMMPPPPCAVDPAGPHSLNCGHPPVKIRSQQGETSLGFVVNRASCCANSGNLLCDAHAGNAPGGPRLQYSTVSHGDHIDFVIDGHLRHPTTERADDGQLLWEDCGELFELDEDTVNDMYNILA